MNSLRHALDFRGPPIRSARSLAAQLALAPPTDSLAALLLRAGPFDPLRDGFAFTNSFPLTELEARQVIERYETAVDVAATALVSVIRLALLGIALPIIGGLPNPVSDYVLQRIAKPARDKVLEMAIAAVPGQVGRCGGMAFAALDLYWARRSAYALGGHPPSGSPLDVYIFQRLLDSLDAHLGDYLSAMARLFVLPSLSAVASGLLGAAAGALAGPVGGAIGAYVAGEADVLGLGGCDSLMDDNSRAIEQLAVLLKTHPAWPIGLVYADRAVPWDNHQVLATRLDDLGAGRYRLSIHDNNLPTIDRDKNLYEHRIDILDIDMSGSSLRVTDAAPKRGDARYLQIAALITQRYEWRPPPLLE